MRFQEFSQFKIRPHLFENKQQYKQIVDTMVNGGVIDRAEAENTLKDAKSLLKRADRITWWLRWWRIAKTGEVFQDRMEDLDSKSRESETAQEKQEYRAEIRNLGKQFEKLTKKSFLDYLDDSSDFPSVFDLHALKNHWSAKFEQSPQINHVEWAPDLSPSTLRRRLQTAENEWKQKQQQEIEPEPNDQIVIDYGKQAWVKLDREYCDKEGNAMEHCGNTATPEEGDRILSFRTKLDGGKQKPHLTFILDKNGDLGQMKGRRNNKPSEKYHPYIIDLLKQDFVKGIKGGGSLPENNFSITDLDQEKINKLISQKPVLITPEEAYNYAKNVIKGRWPEAEEAFAQKPGLAYHYAKTVIKGRFYKGEEAIAQSPRLAYYYAKTVIEGRWPETEKVIAQDSEIAVQYARDVIGGRWPELEDSIAQDPNKSYYYARDAIDGRFYKGEEAIAQRPGLAYDYAKTVIKGRWPAVEEAIAQSPRLAYYYAKNVIKGRWPETEKVIAQDPDFAYDYARRVIEGRWPEGEEAIAQDAMVAYLYARNVIGGRFPEGEAAVKKSAFRSDYEQEFGVDLDKEVGNR